METNESSELCKEGWLQKRGEHIKTWRPRYFILKTDGNFLGYNCRPLSENDRAAPNNVFHIKDCLIVTSDKPKCNAFTLKCASSDKDCVERTFATSNSAERDEWIKCIGNVSNHLNGEIRVDKSSERIEKITLHDFEFLKVLGKGTFGKVVLCRENLSKRLCAMKMLKKSLIISKNEVVHTETENKVLRAIKHPFITGLVYSFQTTDRLCLVMEYVNGGELFFHLSRERKFGEAKARFYCAEICCAIGFLHQNQIIYRDIKLENILLDCDGHIKLADFGLCKMNMSHESQTDTFCGTLEYLAPEIVWRNVSSEEVVGGYTRAVDWWAVGVVLYEMLVGRLPFSSKSADSLSHDYKALFDKILHDEVRFPLDLSEQAKQIISQLLTKEPSKRLGSGCDDFDEVKRHEFFADIDWAKLSQRQLEPPFKPLVASEVDTRYFEQEFTGENVQLTPPTSDSACVTYYFDSFSYYGSKTSLSSHVSMRSSGQISADQRFDVRSLITHSANLKTQTVLSNENLAQSLLKRSKLTHGSLSQLNPGNNLKDSAGSSLFLAFSAFPNMIQFSDGGLARIYQSEAFFSDFNNTRISLTSSSSSATSSTSSHSFSFNSPVVSHEKSYIKRINAHSQLEQSSSEQIS